MTAQNPQPVESAEESPRFETDEHADKRFRGWRLLGAVFTVIFVLALISFLVDWAVIGPLEGRVY